jgi:arylsulfatase A-like enzyme
MNRQLEPHVVSFRAGIRDGKRTDLPKEDQSTYKKIPPDMVFILSDDQAWSDYGFMGHADIKTPHLDTLASSSLFFDGGYVAAPICRPSLASLVTGLFPHQLSCLPLTKPSVCLQPYDQ